MTMRGTSLPDSLARLRTASPSRPGIRMSKSPASIIGVSEICAFGALCIRAASACGPSSASTTRYPRLASNSESDVRAVLSSSPIRIVLLLSIVVPPELQNKRSPAGGRFTPVKARSHTLCEFTRHGQAQPMASRLSRVEGFKNVLLLFGSQARPLIGDFDCNVAVIAGGVDFDSVTAL